MVRRGRGRPLDPDDVLAGRVEPRLEDLFDAVHAVNPTGAALSEPETAARYRTKAGLQSLLIERFADALQVSAEPDGSIAIRHRYGRRDGCHARLVDLSAPARAWVQRQLDVASEPEDGDTSESAASRGSGAAAQPPPGSADALLCAGRRALDEYDYELARESFERAWDDALGSGNDAIEPARALLDLLVDHLFDNEAALAAADRLGGCVTTDDELRGLVALAAVRAGDAARAETLCAGLQGERADEVRIELARAALQHGDLVACERLLATVPLASPHAAAGQELGRALSARKSEACAPLERAARAAVADRDWERAEQLVLEIESVYPQSAVARSVLGAIERHRREERRSALVARVEDALAREDAALAAGLWREAVAAGVDRPELAARVEHLRRESEKLAAERAIGELVSLLKGGITPAVVGAYWSAAPMVRERARDQVDSAAARWLDELGDVHGRSRCHAAAESVAALVRAEQLTRGGDVEAAEAELSAVEHHVTTFVAARKELARVRDEARQHRRRSALETMRRAEDGEPAAADRLAEIAAADLDPEGRARLAELLRESRRVADIARRSAAFEECVAGGNPLAAREHVDRILAAVDGDEHAEWLDRQRELDERIRAAWLVESVTGEVVAESLQDVQVHDGACPWLLPCGSILLLPSVVGRFAAVRWIDLEDAERSRAVCYACSEDIGYAEFSCDGESLWICGARGRVLELDAASGDVRSWTLLEQITSEARSCNESFVAPRSRCVWAREDLAEDWLVLDLRTRKVARRVRAFSAHPVHASGEVCVMTSRDHGDVTLCDATGRAIWTMREPGWSVSEVAPHPVGDGLIVAGGRESESEAHEPLLVLRELVRGTRGWRVGSELEIDGASSESMHALATSREEGLAMLYCYTADGPRILTARPTARGLAVCHSLEANRISPLAHDAHARRVRVLVTDGPRVHAVPLDARTPDLSKEPSECGEGLGSPSDGLRFCSWDEPGIRERVHECRRVISKGLALDTLALQSVLHDCRRDRVLACALVRALHGEIEPCREVERQVLAWHPEDPRVIVAVAHERIRRGDVRDGVELLDAVEVPRLFEHTRQHAHHLRGVASLEVGDVDAAHVHLVRARDAAGGCDVDTALELAEALRAPLDGLLQSPKGSHVRAIVGAWRGADRAIERGDPAAAIDLLDRRAVWREDNPQLLGRLAAAWLAVEPAGAAQRFRKRLALAAFCGLDRGASADAAMFGKRLWSQERLEEIGSRAKAWLDRV